KLALQECGRRLGVFLRKRERAKSEFRRRNIFELYIEEVVDACARLKVGKVSKDKLRAQLQKIAAKRTGGVKTDEILGRESGPEGLPHSIIVTPEGIAGEAPASVGSGQDQGGPPEGPQPEPEIPAATAKAKVEPARPATPKARPAHAARGTTRRASTPGKRRPAAVKRTIKTAPRRKR